jgi:ankyrin repeat protein
LNNLKLTVGFFRNRQEGTTALHHAAKEGNANLVRLLLENGADVNATRDFPSDFWSQTCQVACSPVTQERWMDYPITV